MHYSRRFVPQLFASDKQPRTELGILPANLAPRSGPEVCPKTSILPEHNFPKGHVRTKRRLCQESGFKSEVEDKGVKTIPSFSLLLARTPAHQGGDPSGSGGVLQSSLT